MSADLPRGAIRVRGVSRRFRIVHERNATLKEALLRRRRTTATELWALRDVDLDVRPGEALGIIGQNGSGKSTLLKLVAGILPPQAGTVETSGTVASMLELGSGFHPDFTGRENVYMNGAILGLSEREVDERLDAIVAFAELEGFIDMPVKTYSSGMQMRLAFAVSSHVEADILLLDEVLAVGDEAFQRKCIGRIFAFRRRGGTLLLVSHDAASIERVCDRAIVIDGGEVVEDGHPADVLAAYHKRLAGHGRRPSAHPDEGDATDEDPRTWGTREVVITDVRLVGPRGLSDRFMSGEPLTIELDATAVRPVETPIFGIVVSSTDGVHLYGTNTQLDSMEMQRVDGAVTVRFTIERLSLHEGSFSVTVAITSADGAVIFHWLDRWKEFSVFQRSTGVGPVDLSGSWEIGAARDTAAVVTTKPADEPPAG